MMMYFIKNYIKSGSNMHKQARFVRHHVRDRLFALEKNSCIQFHANVYFVSMSGAMFVLIKQRNGC